MKNHSVPAQGVDFELIEKLFHEADVDGSGALDMAELCKVVRDVARCNKIQWTQAQVASEVCVCLCVCVGGGTLCVGGGGGIPYTLHNTSYTLDSES